MRAVKGSSASNGKDGNTFFGAHKSIFQDTRLYRHALGDIPRDLPSFFLLFEHFHLGTDKMYLKSPFRVRPTAFQNIKKSTQQQTAKTQT